MKKLLNVLMALPIAAALLSGCKPCTPPPTPVDAAAPADMSLSYARVSTRFEGPCNVTYDTACRPEKWTPPGWCQSVSNGCSVADKLETCVLIKRWEGVSSGLVAVEFDVGWTLKASESKLSIGALTALGGKSKTLASAPSDSTPTAERISGIEHSGWVEARTVLSFRCTGPNSPYEVARVNDARLTR